MNSRERIWVTAGYDTEEGRSVGWSPHWIVIGQDAGDPVFVDSRDGSVASALHGTGAWNAVRLAGSMPDFLLTLTVWTATLARHGDSPLDGDLMPSGPFFEDVRQGLIREGLPAEPMNQAWETFTATT